MVDRRYIGLALVLMIMLLEGCLVSWPGADQLPRDQILGQWQSTLGGFPIMVEYGEVTVTVGDNQPISYQLLGNELTFAEGGAQVRIVSFPDGDSMIQQDPITGTSHAFTRVSSGEPDPNREPASARP